ncbi:MAG: murein biosynthesis integral membrane protein MurJ [Polyangiales bacterium]
MNDQSSAEANVGVERPTIVAEERGAERAAIAGRAGLVGAGTLVSRVLGLARDLVLAAMFPRALTDLFFVAFTIPNALRQLLAEGALSSAFVPVLAKVEADEGPKEAAKFYARLRGLMWIVLIATCAIGVMAAPLLCELFAAGFHARPGAFERTVAVTRAVFPYLLFMGLAALGAGALQVRKKFGVAAFAPALLNVGMILGALLLAPILVAHGSDPLYALAIGALVGGALQVWAQMPDLKRAGFTEQLAIDLKDPKLRLVLARIAPMTVGLMIYEIDLVLSRRFLSEAGEGANSWFYYAQRLCDFPQGIFSLALATATLPSLAKLVAKGDREEVARTAAHALRLALWVALPATALLVALARPLVIAFFARGKFDAASIDGTTAALIVQGLGVFVVAVVRQIVPLYYALGDTKTPVLVSGMDLVAFIAIALLLRGPIGHVGVSAAVTGSSIVQMILLVIWVKKPLPELRASMIVPSAAKSALAAIVAGGIAFAVALVCRPLGNLRVIGGLLPAIAGCAAFAAAYLAIGRLVGQEEQAQLMAGLRRRLRRRAL